MDLIKGKKSSVDYDDEDKLNNDDNNKAYMKILNEEMNNFNQSEKNEEKVKENLIIDSEKVDSLLNEFQNLENNEEMNDTKELSLSELSKLIESECYDYNYNIQNNQGEEIQDKQDTENAVYYQQEEKELEAVLNKYYIEKIPCGNDYVSDGIGCSYKYWEPDIPIFISAQTGSGKNHFIENILIPYVHEIYHETAASESKRCKILILSNRIALNFQMKKRLIRNFRLKGFEKFTDSDIIKQSEFDFITILSYQNLLSRPKYSPIDFYTHVVCDECHFFTSDAMFNPNTDRILKLITSDFKDSIRIYMSATLDDCIEYILDKERYDNKFKYYQFDRNYSYFNIQYFSDDSQLYDIILNNASKWLIFIDNKNQCKQFKENLIKKEKEHLKKDSIKKKKDIEVIVINSENKDDENYQKLIAEEKFKEKVLISTSVIDNGVSFHDEELTNIVVSEINKSKCLQMVGRIRVKKGNRINLYIKEFDKNDIKKQIEYLDKQEDAYTLYQLAYIHDYYYEYKNEQKEFMNKYYNGTIFDFEDAKHWFYRGESPEYVFFNEIAYSMLKKLKKRYNSILKEMEMQESGGGKKYLEYQLKHWFNQDYDEKNDVTIQGKAREEKKLIDFLDSWVGNSISSSEQPNFRKTFTKLSKQAFGKWDTNKNRINNINVISKILSERNMDFTISSAIDKNTEKTFWSIARKTDISKS